MTRRSITLAILMVVLAACGGGTGPTQVPGATAAGGGGTPTGAPVATTPGGGESGTDVCALLTVDEAAGAMGTGPLTAAARTLDARYDVVSCAYTLADAEEALRVDYQGKEAVFNTEVGNGDEVSGVGDRAIFDRGSRILRILVGSAVVGVFPRYVGGADAAQAAATTIGKIIAARLTTGTVPPDAQVTAAPVVSANSACDLLSADEAASVLDKGAMTAAGNEVTPQFCTYSIASSGEVIATTFFQKQGGTTSWGMFEASMTTDPVAGLGEKAMFEPSTNILFVLQGDTIFNVNVLTVGISGADALAQGTELAQIMLTHL